MRFIAVLFICSFALAACTKSRSTTGKGQPGAGAPKASAPGAKAPTAPPGAPATTPPPPPPGSPPAGTAPPPPATAGKPGPGEKGGPPLKQPTIPKKDGPALSTYLANVKQVIAGEGKVTDDAAIKAILAALNPTQKVGGNRKACEFRYQFAFMDGAGKDLAGLGICSPLGANTLAILGDNKSSNEWQLTIPNSKTLAGLLDKHLPASKVK